MPRLLTTSVAIWAIGCVVPAPLEAETAPVKHPPRIVSGAFCTCTDGSCASPPVCQDTPTFTPQSVMRGIPWGFAVTAVDEDLGDQLIVRSFVLDGEKLDLLHTPDVPLSGTSATDPTTRSAQVPVFDYCQFAVFKAGTPRQVYAYVTDGQWKRFNSTPYDSDFKEAGAYDFKFWEVTCQ